MADNTIHIDAQIRTEFGKGASRRARAASKVPAVLYGHGTDPVHLVLPAHDTMMALKHSNAILSLNFDGKSELALAKDVQRDPIKPIIKHVDLVIVKRGEKVVVEVLVVVEGEATGADAVVTLEHPHLALEVDALHIPEQVTVSVDGLQAGSQIFAKDVTLPSGAALAADEDTLVVNISVSAAGESEEGEEAAGAGDAAEANDAAEGE